MQRLLATMITSTTYGTWLPGDVRGFVEDGVILPGDPRKLAHAQQLMSDDAVYLTVPQQAAAFDALREAARLYEYALLAVSIESWHVHLLVNHRMDAVGTVAGRLKAAMRQAVDRGRIWTTGYDKRFCFTPRDVTNRQRYIQRHAGHRPL